MTRLTLAAITLILAAAPLTPVAAQDLLWMRQAGTATSEYVGGVALDGAGNVYITGQTNGSLFGPHVGRDDVFLAKYDPSGVLVWARQTGTAGEDRGRSVALDGGGNVYITGYTDRSLGGRNAGFGDAFVMKYDPSGTLLWARQFGTSASEDAVGVAVDHTGNAYITGRTAGSLGGPNAGADDVFLVMYDTTGVQLWKRQIGSVWKDFAAGVAVDSEGNAYLGGSTQETLGETSLGWDDAFLAKFDASGALLWTRQFGTSEQDFGRGIAVDGAGTSYVCGETSGSLGGPNAGYRDVFLAKYDTSGALIWTRQIGTSESEYGLGVAVDGSGNAFVTGTTNGTLGGPYAGNGDAVLIKFNASGNLVWTRQIGTTAGDGAGGVAVNGAGEAYIAGNTNGSLGASNAGDYDIFLAKFGPFLCPADFNHDGFVTGDDFDSFSLAFIAGDAAADFDHNGFVTGDDFDAYVAAFEAGC